MLNDALHYENKLTIVYIGAPPPPPSFICQPPLYIHMKRIGIVKVPPLIYPPPIFKPLPNILLPVSSHSTFPPCLIKCQNMHDTSPNVFANMTPPHNTGCQPVALHGRCLPPTESLLGMRNQEQGVLFRMWGTSPVENQSLCHLSPPSICRPSMKVFSWSSLSRKI